MKVTTVALLMLSSVEAKHHSHHHKHSHNPAIMADTQVMESLNSMTTEKLVNGLQNTLKAALEAEAKDDKASAVAKTAAIKNI